MTSHRDLDVGQRLAHRVLRVRAMKTALSSSMCASGCGSPALTNCGRNIRKKIDSLKSERAGVEERHQPQHRRRHMRDDAERAAESGDDAGPRAARKAGREGEEHAGPGRGDDDEGGEEEFEGHRRGSFRAGHIVGGVWRGAL